MEYNYLQRLYTDVIAMMKHLVIKREDLARANETIWTLKAYELYEACLRGDTTIFNFNLDVKALSKYMKPDKARHYVNNLGEIPEELRLTIVRDMNKYIIENYEEENEYYRMLMGLPELEDKKSDYIYIKGFDDIPEDVPIHELSAEQIDKLDMYGELKKIQEKYPDKHYLHYLGLNRIDHLKARRAKPYEILRLGVPTNMANWDIFMGEYYSARRYVMATMVNPKMFYKSDYYVPVMGIIMLMLAVKNTMVPTESMYLSYEEIIDLILDSYEVLPYFKRMPFTYKRKLAIAMDRLLMIKGTDQVIVDLCHLFSYDNLVANRYYIAKIPARDANGRPIVVTKDDGSLDYEQMYTLKFIKSDIENKDIDFKPEDYVDYDTLTLRDPLWQLTDEEVAKFKADDYNIMLSKYISIEAAYDLSALTYEVNYFINLLLNHRVGMAEIQITNMYSTTGYSTGYAMLLFLLSLFALRAGYDGNIVYDPEGIAEVYKMDVDELAETAESVLHKVREQDETNPYIVNGVYTGDLSVDTLFQTRGKLLQFNYNPDVTQMAKILDMYQVYDIDAKDLVPEKPIGRLTADQFIKVYLTNTNIYKMIVEEMKTTTDYQRYEALSQLKKILFTSAYTAKNFEKADGTLAKTYLDMLRDIDPKLARKVDDLSEEEDDAKLDEVVLYAMEKMEQLFSSPELEYLFINTPNISCTLISKYLRNAIEIFKASSVEFTTINIIFEYGDECPIRVIDRNAMWVRKYTYDDVWIEDEIAFHKYMVLDDYVNIEPKLYIV